MKKIANDALPQPVLDHLAACRRHDIAAFIATLAPDALVNDARREFLGHAAIRAWAEKEIFGAKVTKDVETAFEQNGGYIVRCRVDGEFDKTNLPDPLILTYYFDLDRTSGLIGRLVILLNSANAA